VAPFIRPDHLSSGFLVVFALPGVPVPVVVVAPSVGPVCVEVPVVAPGAGMVVVAGAGVVPAPGTVVVDVPVPGTVVAGVPAAGTVTVRVIVVGVPLDPVSDTSAAVSAPSDTTITATSPATGGRQRGVGASRVRAAVPHRKHQSWSASSGVPHSGQRSTGCCSGSVPDCGGGATLTSRHPAGG
jgi:hypothetical protein